MVMAGCETNIRLQPSEVQSQSVSQVKVIKGQGTYYDIGLYHNSQQAKMKLTYWHLSYDTLHASLVICSI